MHPFRKFIKQFSHFFSGMIAAQLFSFITFPIFTRVLTKEQYGILGLVTTTMYFAIAFAKAGLSDGIIRFYDEYSKAPEKKEIFSSTVMSRGVVLSALTSLAFILLFPLLQKSLNISGSYTACFMIMVLYLFFNPLNIIVTRMLRVNDKTVFINMMNIVGRTISVGLSLVFLLYVSHSFYGYFIGLVTAELIMAVILFSWFFKHYRVTPSLISRELSVKMIKFGAPLLLAELAFLLISYSDRYLIVGYLGEEALGLYSVGYNIAMYIGNIIMFSLQYSMVPISVQIYGEEGKEGAEAFLNKCLRYVLMAIIPMWFGYLAVSKELFIVLASAKYAAAAVFSPLILLAYFLGAVSATFDARLYLKKKTIVTFLIEVSGIILNIGLNLILLKKLGIMGASIAALLSSITQTFLFMIISNRYFGIKVEVGSILYYIGVSCIMFLIVTQINTGVIWINLILKLITGTVLIALAILLKESEIREGIKKVIRGGSDKDLQLR
jgi:O-antigen/teichoic acid export membrane protein